MQPKEKTLFILARSLDISVAYLKGKGVSIDLPMLRRTCNEVLSTERKGIKILTTKLPKNVLGLCTWADGTHPLVVLDTHKDKHTTERWRMMCCTASANPILKFLPSKKNLRKRFFLIGSLALRGVRYTAFLSSL